MLDELLVLIDESDFCTKDHAIHLLALNMAHQLAHRRGLTAVKTPHAYDELVWPLVDEIERKLRSIIALGAP